MADVREVRAMTTAGECLIDRMRSGGWSMTDLFMVLACKPDYVLDLVFNVGFTPSPTYMVAVSEDLGETIGPNPQAWMNMFLADRSEPGAVLMIPDTEMMW